MAERWDVIGGIDGEDNRNGEDETKRSEEETLIVSESGNEIRWCEEECLIGG